MEVDILCKLALYKFVLFGMRFIFYRMKELNISCDGTYCFECSCEGFQLSQIIKLLEIDNLTHPELFTIIFKIPSSFTNNSQLAELFYPIKDKKHSE